MSKLTCETCVHLDKTTKEALEISYRYGCKKSSNRYMSFWILKDSDLKNCGCSEYKEKMKQKI